MLVPFVMVWKMILPGDLECGVKCLYLAYHLKLLLLKPSCFQVPVETILILLALLLPVYCVQLNNNTYLPNHSG